MDIDGYLGRRLFLRRRLMGWTQQQLAAVVGVRFQQIQKYESGLNKISAGRLWRLALALNVPVGYFYEGLDRLPSDVSRPLPAKARADQAEP